MTDEVSAPQAMPTAKGTSVPAKSAPPEKIAVVLLDDVAGPRGSIARLIAVDAKKLIAAGSARAATADDFALAYPNFLPGD